MRGWLLPGWLTYVLIALAVVFIGVYYVTGLDPVKLIAGKNPFAAPTIEVIPGFTLAEGPSGSHMSIAVSNLKISYDDGKEQELVEILPVLDLGDNPLLDAQSRLVKCRFSDSTDDYECGTAQLEFVLKPESIQSFKNLGRPDTPVQLYFFRKTDAIKSYITSGGAGKTTTNLLITYNDFYIHNELLGTAGTSDIQDAAATVCARLGKEACAKSADCYLDLLQKCIACPLTDTCSEFATMAACRFCRFAQQNHCDWGQTGISGGIPLQGCKKR